MFNAYSKLGEITKADNAANDAQLRKVNDARKAHRTAVHAAVAKIAKDTGLSHLDAMRQLRRTNPDVFA